MFIIGTIVAIAMDRLYDPGFKGRDQKYLKSFFMDRYASSFICLMNGVHILAHKIVANSA